MRNAVADPAATRQATCPECQTIIPLHAGYVTWCDRCGWNLKPDRPEPRNTFEAIYTALGRKQSQALLDRFVKAGSLRATLTPAKVLACAIAAPVHLLTVALWPLGVALLVAGRTNIVTFFGGILCLLAAWTLRPRPTEAPGGIVTREDFPALYTLVDAVARALGASPPYRIALDEEFNASYRLVGWRRRAIVTLGLPLWSILDDRERVALVAHELAHGVNGDGNRSFFIGTAIETLVRWHDILRPDHIAKSEDGIYGLAAIPVNVLLLGLSGVACLGARALIHMLYRDSQRAEYLADYLGATASGTDAALSLLDRMHFGKTFALTLQRATVNGHDGRRLFAYLRQRMTEVPERELERVRRVQQLESSRLDVTHPPTAYRIALLKAHRVSQPKVDYSSIDFQQVAREAATVEERIQQRLLDRALAGLYG